jgi:hypothetical protein
MKIGLPPPWQRSGLDEKVSLALQFECFKAANTVSAPGATFRCPEQALETTISSFADLLCVSRLPICSACPLPVLITPPPHPPFALLRSGNAETIEQKHAAELQVNNGARFSKLMFCDAGCQG